VLGELVSGVYGPASHSAYAFMKLMDAVEYLERTLAAQAMKDHPGQAGTDVYGHKGAEAAAQAADAPEAARRPQLLGNGPGREPGS
jgi:hypothetical protein